VAAPVQAGPTATTPAWQIVAEYPHPTEAFTEGLAFDRAGHLIESTGRYGRSTLSVFASPGGAALHAIALDPEDFGELAVHPLAHEGWGLAYDGRRLIASDGSATLHFLDPQDLHETGELLVRDGDRPIAELNELEFARGKLFANVWHSDRIAVIDLASGRVLHWLDLSALYQRLPKAPDWDSRENVLNGIDYDRRNGHFYVTGKCGPMLFDIAVMDHDSQ
jgi:glutamine cyclotransferase